MLAIAHFRVAGWVGGCVGVGVWGVFLKTFGRGAWTAS